MSFKNQLRNVIPPAMWQTMGFIKRVPHYWNLDRSSNLCVKNGLADNHLFWNNDFYITIPESLTAYICWRSHGFEEQSSRQEAIDFLELTQGCSSFVDIGAQTGFMSALFAKSRKGAYKVLSVEPDTQVLPVLQRAAELNKSDQGDWTVAAVAVSDVNQVITLPVSNTLFEKSGDAAPESMTVECQTLTDLLTSVNWMPDVLKIDVESFEYEILTSSLDLIGRQKPALQLEVHWEILEGRGKSALDFLKPLSDLGYRGIRKTYRDLEAWERSGRKEKVSRMALRGK